MLQDEDGFFTVAGFGSLLSERSSRSTFPELQNFRAGKIKGWRRIFAHCADIFYERGIARPETGEVSSLSCEPHRGGEVVVALFEVPATPEAVAAFVEREQEFRFTAVAPVTLQGEPTGRMAVLCAKNTDDNYRARRCPPEEFERRWAKHGVTKIWRDDILPCRVYLRHCVLAAQHFCPEAYENFLDQTYLGDRTTTVRQYLKVHPDIMQELPPPSLAQRYCG